MVNLSPIKQNFDFSFNHILTVLHVFPEVLFSYWKFTTVL